jgi:hypothetical protein
VDEGGVPLEKEPFEKEPFEKEPLEKLILPGDLLLS